MNLVPVPKNAHCQMIPSESTVTTMMIQLWTQLEGDRVETPTRATYTPWWCYSLILMCSSCRVFEILLGVNVFLSSGFRLERPPAVASAHDCTWLVNWSGPRQATNCTLCLSGRGAQRIAAVVTTKRLGAREELLLCLCSNSSGRRDVQQPPQKRVPIPKTIGHGPGPGSWVRHRMRRWQSRRRVRCEGADRRSGVGLGGGWLRPARPDFSEARGWVHRLHIVLVELLRQISLCFDNVLLVEGLCMTFNLHGHQWSGRRLHLVCLVGVYDFQYTTSPEACVWTFCAAR